MVVLPRDAVRRSSIACQGRSAVDDDARGRERLRRVNWGCSGALVASENEER